LCDSRLKEQEKGVSVADIRINRYSVNPADFDELLVRRAELISAIRADHPGLVEARLIRLENGTFIDAWRWGSREQMQAALAAAAPTFPEVAAAMSLTRDRTAEDGEIVDER
jgi:hypothetical protein